MSRFSFLVHALAILCLAASGCGGGSSGGEDGGSDPIPNWNTFLGSTDSDGGTGLVLGSDSSVIVAGLSYESWGTPLASYTDFNDPFVAKFDSSGNLLWNTFVGVSGSSGVDGPRIAVDSAGNIYVTGISTGNWGDPINPHQFGYENFVAKLSPSGSLLWNTFLNSMGYGQGADIALDKSGNIYVIGSSIRSWGFPVRPLAGYENAFVAKLSNSGQLLWNTFLGSDSYGNGACGLGVDDTGSVYVTGYCAFSWGSPIRPHAGDGTYDAFVARLDSGGHLVWNTFLGAGDSSEDYGYGIAVGAAGEAFVTGTSRGGTWGSPVSAFNGFDAFVAKLDTNGNLAWNTFLGSSDWDEGKDITLGGNGHLYVTGDSYRGWGPGSAAYAGYSDGFAAELDGSGNLVWNTFVGSNNEDHGLRIAVDGAGTIFLAGSAAATWGQPIRAYSGGTDAFAARISRGQ